MNTRGLSGMTTNRIADEVASLVFLVRTFNLDGSHSVVESPFTTMASVVPVPAKEIQRLQEGGVELRNGISIALAAVPGVRPDRIDCQGRQWRVVTWSFIREFDEYDEYDEYTEPRGSVVAICDEILTGAAS